MKHTKRLEERRDTMRLNFLENVPNLQIEYPRQGLQQGWNIYRFDANTPRHGNGSLRDTLDIIMEDYANAERLDRIKSDE